MKAWQFVQTHHPLLETELAEPEAAPGQVVIEVRAAGLCHSDVGLLQDETWKSVLAKTPITPGHEIAGIISQIGAGVTGWSAGDGVAVCPIGRSYNGYHHDGGYQPKVIAFPEDLARVPEGVTWLQAAAATDAGMSSFHAVNTQSGGITEGMTVGIIGFGGLGSLGVQEALLLGAEVYVAEIGDRAAKNASQLPVKGVAKSLREFTDKGVVFDVIIDFAGFGSTTAEAVDTIGRGGTVVVVGMGQLQSTISTNSLIRNECRLVGSRGGTLQDIRDVLDLFATGKLDLEINEITWEQIPAALDDLKNHRTTGRTVVNYDLGRPLTPAPAEVSARL